MLALALASQLVADRAIVVGRVDDGPWSDAPTEARLDQSVELAAVVVGHRGKHQVVLAPSGVSKLKLAGHGVAVEALPAVKVHWFAVEPHGFRAQAARNGATSDFYSNVSTEPKSFGKWLGYDHIDYF